MRLLLFFCSHLFADSDLSIRAHLLVVALLPHDVRALVVFATTMTTAEKVVNPIMKKVYQASGGADGGDEEAFGL